MEPAKVKIRVGSLELEYEGDPSFLKDGLNELLAHVAEISTAIPQTGGEPIVQEEVLPAVEREQGGTIRLTLSTSSIAARVSPKTGPELAICAMAHLELVQGLQTYDRRAILDEMKQAPAYYKQSMSGNHSATITGLVKAKRVNEVGTGKYCLSAVERTKVETSIA